jgi:3'(2'), 5'-bisphosphate nucleotidase
MDRLTAPLLGLALRAGDEILTVYEGDDFETEHKADESPLTLDDRRSHDVLDEGLRALTPDIPILSEEGRSIPYEERSQWGELWLVDPLDGTKEFIKRNGEFTVNIALVQHGEPVLGVVYAPDRHEAWVGIAPGSADAEEAETRADTPFGAWKLGGDALSLFRTATDPAAQGQASAETAGHAPNLVAAAGTPIRVRARDARRISIIASRTHLNDATKELIDRVSAGFSDVEIVNVGSSLKLCYVADGRADLYPRYAPTSEWDTAAGHAIVRAAGGEIYQAGPDADHESASRGTHADGSDGHRSVPLRYNKEDLLNPWFVVRAW